MLIGHTDARFVKYNMGQNSMNLQEFELKPCNICPEPICVERTDKKCPYDLAVESRDVKVPLRTPCDLAPK